MDKPQMNLGLSPDATRKVERMVNDLAFVTYPAHLVIDGLRTVIYCFVAFALLVLSLCWWVVSTKSDRADLIHDFIVRQDVVVLDFGTSAEAAAPFTTTIKHLNTTDAYLVSDNLIATRKRELSEFLAYCNADNMHNPRWDDGQNWLSNKSDAMLAAYLTGARNIDALRLTLASLKAGEAVPATQACSPTTGSSAMLAAYPTIVIPNAPQVVVTRVAQTKYEDEFPANNWRKNWMTGICLAGNCRRSDYSPRNTSIFYDVMKPQMFPHQQEAVDALNATGTPGFWLAAAHANGITDRDSQITSAALSNQAQTTAVLAHSMSADEQSMIVLQIAFVCVICLVVLLFTYPFLKIGMLVIRWCYVKYMPERA